MAQIPIIEGIYTDGVADFRTSYPLNLVPVPKPNGISKGYLRTADGLVQFGINESIPGVDRGAINWRGVCYRVRGSTLMRVDANGTITALGDVGDDGRRVTLAYGFDKLSIASNGGLFYYDIGSGVTQVTDPDLGVVLDQIWISGYYMTTDGANLVVTELNDPYAVNPLKYGSSEASPDPVNGLLSIRNEAVAINRYTTEYFQNVGGSGFPFARNEGAMIPKGSVGTHASCYYLETFAFVGSGPNENISVYVGAPGQAVKIATREIETILEGYTEAQQTAIIVEARSTKVHQFLYVHLPDKSLVYDAAASKAVGDSVWHILASGLNGDEPYRARNYVQCYGKWLAGTLGGPIVAEMTPVTAAQLDTAVPWQFDTSLAYANNKGLIFNDLELLRLGGRSLPGDVSYQASIFLSYTQDGMTWSNPRSGGITGPGLPQKRTAWRRLGRTAQWRGMRLRGMNNPQPDSFACLETELEPTRV